MIFGLVPPWAWPCAMLPIFPGWIRYFLGPRQYHAQGPLGTLGSAGAELPQSLCEFDHLDLDAAP